MKRIVLGVSGSIAAYRAADLARELMRAGCEVRVCLTDAAQNFVTPILFETLTGHPCLTGVFDEPVKGRMAHIDWAREADLLVIAPATANTINRLAQGVGEDMLTSLALAYRGPMVIAPAMNPSMFAHDATRASLQSLRERGAFIVDPMEGDVVAGETGPGKLAPVDEIRDQILAVLSTTQVLKGKRVLITSGPTQEPIDDVRFLSNRSSGKMGAALARAAILLGAEVTVVTGPTTTPLPLDAKVLRVESAEEMLFLAANHLEGQDWVIGAAAVADYHVANRVKGKIRRGAEPMRLELAPNPDIIAALAERATPPQRIVGFAAEPSEGLETAKEKLVRKGLFAIAVNDVSRKDIGFSADHNEISLVFTDGSIVESGKKSKLEVALWLWHSLAAR
jgi:phosphopantothenoylcysteine decarboxylase/phosphopantothenate--cysteine ligase